MFNVVGCLASASDISPSSADSSGPSVHPSSANGARSSSSSAWHCQNQKGTNLLGEMGPIYKLCLERFHDVGTMLKFM